MRGQEDPHGRTIIARPPTVGQLAARVNDLAARPETWWPLATFGAAPVTVPLEEAEGIRVWLTTWPPGRRDEVNCQVSTLVAGELGEVVITPDGVSERPLRANRVRVHGGGAPTGGAHPGGAHASGARAFTNPGPAYAITLHS
ncbi:cysteine dioxygenase [Actinomadura terrae]|uniref:cysteine dioxygenase n=1 Tax=Actinomadura terrae TaxID=604353 RepID=UPI001FA7CCA4|nr:cysteine dioxygenase [Actinomadura terrae]